MELATHALSKPRDAYYWRLLATAASFCLFGIGGLCLRVLVFPLLACLPGDAQAHRRRARAVVSRLFWLFIRFMYRTGVLTYSVSGAERLGRPGQMIIANHPSLIDVVFLIGLVRDANCVVKQSLWQNPFTRGPVRSTGYISNDGSMDMLDAAADALKQGQTLIIFPEGTRNLEESGLLPFKSGIFHLATQHPDVELVPVWIANLNRVMPKGRVLPLPLLCTTRFGAALTLEPGESKEQFLQRSREALLELAEEHN